MASGTAAGRRTRNRIARRDRGPDHRRRRGTTHPGVVDPVTARPNDTWTVDLEARPDFEPTFRSTGAQARSAPTMAPPSARARSAGSRISSSVGCASGSSTSGSGHPAGAAAGLRRVPARFRRGTAAHLPRRHTARAGLHPVAAALARDRLPPLECPGHLLVKRVTDAGTFRFHDRLFFIDSVLQ